MPFIQSVYWASVVNSTSGSACAENVAFGLQNALQASQPLPVSHASKKAFATLVMLLVVGVMVISCLIRLDASGRSRRDRRISHLARGTEEHRLARSVPGVSGLSIA